MCILSHSELHFSVDVFDDTLRTKLEEKFEDGEIFATLIDEAYYNVTIQSEQKKISKRRKVYFSKTSNFHGRP